MSGFRYLFGPVPSRRLGRSLGVDLIPPKTCSMNCVFCQLGPTAMTTVERREWVPLDTVCSELAAWRRAGGEADFITLAGSGEPTLHTGFGRIIECAREEIGVPSALLTNGSLLSLDDVCSAAVGADLVKVTLSAWDQKSFEAIHRPHPSLRFDRFFEGEKRLRGMCRGKYWAELFLVPGLNDGDEALDRLAGLMAQLDPDRIHINTAVRPPAEAAVRALGRERLEEVARKMGDRAEVVADVPEQEARREWSVPAALALIKRHPCSAAQLARLFGIEEAEVVRQLEAEQRAGNLFTKKQGNVLFWTI